MFKSGTKWIRADFHLHTRADKEFSFTGEDDRFISDYVEKLKKEDIKLGVITNHNKFDLGEYKALRKRAKRENITLFPGVELSVKEGANGIHCLIVFKEEDWINGKAETINQFLDEVFKGTDNREHANVRCNKDLIGTIKCLESYNKNYFILMAHIEQKNGFLEECNGGLIMSLSQSNEFKKSVLGFQKGRTRDKMLQLEEWMGYKLPYIEGSDCKSIEDIGKGEKSFVKIGSNYFDSLLLAFKDFKNRISLSKKNYNHGYIKSVEFKGGKLSGQRINFSPELNSLIGIRGSGKSSLIEAIRYALDMTPSKTDQKYKEEVVDNLLDSGGQLIIELRDSFNNNYKITKILGEASYVYNEKNEKINVTINSILQNPLYFGQKDLSNMDNGFELRLLNKLVGQKNQSFNTNLMQITDKLVNQINQLLSLHGEIDTLPDLKKQLNDIQHKIKIFEEKGLAKKLKKQVNFETEQRKINNVLKLINDFKEDVENLSNSRNFKELKKINNLKSIEMPKLFSKLKEEVYKVLNLKENIQEVTSVLGLSSKRVQEYSDEMKKRVNSLDEEFAEIRREINVPNLNPDDFSKLKMREEKIKETIEHVKKKDELKDKIEREIRMLENERNELLLDEFQVYKKEIEKINLNQDSLKLNIKFKGDKVDFLREIKQSFRGSGINQTAYKNISETYSDFVSLIIDILLDGSKQVSKLITDNQLFKLKEMIIENYNDLLNIRTQNKIEINYHGKPIEKHSIGQRASALILFILSQRENSLIIIDQPEDDLDNQVIYNEIITKIKIRKPSVQFIFATHNANIPVLGDSEQVVAVTHNENQITVKTGSIDDEKIQKRIVNIMEGGKEAFNKRTEIYNLWKM